MCGIAGAWRPEGDNAEALNRWSGRMADSLEHRGPDSSGVWVDAAAGIGLGFRRLAIQDLSAAGEQPMASPCGRFVIVYNGEIYNFRELARELEQEGVGFHGHSDTEVLVTAVSRWGLETTLSRINGMFAFALWDRETRRLTLARDRVGKKPLYYGWCGSVFLFGSELKALRAHPAFAAGIDRQALNLFIQYSWVPTPYSIYEGIRKLPAGTSLTVDPSRPPEEPVAYWSAREKVERGSLEPFSGSFEDAVGALESRLETAVAVRMIADVSLGALLSGGIDSSLVVALMQAQSQVPIKTFTIGFHEAKYNEAPHAAAIAKHLGTDHKELYLTPQDCLDVIPRLPELYDEPFADSSQIPTYVVSRLARGDVTVALSGDGGDELFVGYSAYRRSLDRWAGRRRLPGGLSPLLGEGLRSLSRLVALWPASPNHPPSRAWRLAAKMRKLAASLSAEGPTDLYAKKRLRCKEEEGFVPRGGQAPCLLSDPATWQGLGDPLTAMTYLDFMTYLPDDILVKVDRASMGVSLEVRAPLLDRNVVEFAWQLPLAAKFGPQGGKRVLREVLARHLPRQLFERPKSGFGMPVAEWLSGPLRDWSESLLDESRLRSEGYLGVEAVREAWSQQLSGQRNREQLIWSLLTFQSWLEAERSQATASQPLKATA